MSTITINQTLNPSSDLEKFYNELLQSFPGCVFVTDGSGKVLFVTDAIEKMLGKKTLAIQGIMMFQPQYLE